METVPLCNCEEFSHTNSSLLGPDSTMAREVHDKYAIGNVSNNREVVCDIEVGKVELDLKTSKHVEYVGLHRYLESGYRLIQYQEAWSECLGSCDPDLVTLASRELMRVSVGVISLRDRPLRVTHRPGRAPRPWSSHERKLLDLGPDELRSRQEAFQAGLTDRRRQADHDDPSRRIHTRPPSRLLRPDQLDPRLELRRGSGGTCFSWSGRRDPSRP